MTVQFIWWSTVCVCVCVYTQLNLLLSPKDVVFCISFPTLFFVCVCLVCVCVCSRTLYLFFEYESMKRQHVAKLVSKCVFCVVYCSSWYAPALSKKFILLLDLNSCAFSFCGTFNVVACFVYIKSVYNSWNKALSGHLILNVRSQ